MNVSITFRVALALLLISGTTFSSEPTVEQEKEISSLVNDLGHRRYARRTNATKRLRQVGEFALPDLKMAIEKSEQLEVVVRARYVLARILQDSCISEQLKLQSALVRPGTYEMGSPRSEQGRRADETQHEVTLTRPFYLGAYEITQNEYEKVKLNNPSWFQLNGSGKDKLAKITSTAKFPVEQVTWFDAVDFCNKLSQLEGHKPYYKMADLKLIGNTIESATVTVLGGEGFRLPTEAEWECACRAGTTTAYHFGRTNSGLMANVKDRITSGYSGRTRRPGLGRTTTVGSYKPNAWGLFDMHGNVTEWCDDWYDEKYYLSSSKSDPTGPKTGTHRVTRGGSWLVSNENCRSATRFGQSPVPAKYYNGFRVARTPSKYVIKAISKEGQSKGQE